MRKAKKILLSILSVLTVGVCMLGVAGCDGDASKNTSNTENSDHEEVHVHSYDQEDAEEDYLKKEATCTDKAIYYKSCECGEKGKETFEEGEALGHIEGESVCSRCDTKLYSEGLVYTLTYDETSYVLASIGDCTDTDIIVASAYDGLPVTEIGQRIFLNNENLTSIVIPDSVKKIGAHAFQNCKKLKSVTMSDGVTMIGQYAFSACYQLENIELSGVKTISSYAFQNCSKLKTATLSNASTIGDEAFEYCGSLTSVTLSEKLKSIGKMAFAYCTELTSIKFNGNKGEWLNVTFGYNWHGSVPANKVVCSNGSWDL